ncbi:MAG: hypothetical protein M1829_001074 [Trizodia sp. TS-e1964]|nr:MAG: hypothetical protein M1829_001074 [Trizodia sp. TS-e1964]
MRSAFGSKRKGRKIATEDEQDDNFLKNNDPVDREDKALPSGNLAKPPKSSNSRLSFGPGKKESQDGVEDSEVFTPRKSNLSRQAIEKNALRKSLASADPLPIRAGAQEDRPSYSKESLNELKTLTPSAPKELSKWTGNELIEESDILAKFGPTALVREASLIPTEAEIKEKKERRARLGLEQAAQGDDMQNDVILLSRKSKAETRLVREDEDLGEGFDEFVEDGKISLGKKAEIELQKRRRVELNELINEAEGNSSDDSNSSEEERTAAYEVAQTRAGTGSYKNPYQQSGPRTPPIITPLPSLEGCLERLQAELVRLRQAEDADAAQLAELSREKAEIAGQEVEIQRLMTEKGREYERLKAAAGMTGDPDAPIPSIGLDRGLDNYGDASPSQESRTW